MKSHNKIHEKSMKSQKILTQI